MRRSGSAVLQKENEEDLGAGCEVPLSQRVPHSNRESEDRWARLHGLEVDTAISQL